MTRPATAAIITRMDDGGWQRRCALCGALDAEHAQATPDEADSWQCARCDAVRYLWEPAQIGTARPATG